MPQSVRVGRVSWLPISLVRVKEWHTADFDLGSMFTHYPIPSVSTPTKLANGARHGL